jgi:DNA-binding NtrC family response regulator
MTVRHTTLLIIEDDQLLNRLLGEQLASAGYRVQGVHSLAEAEAWLKGHECQLILTDMRLPDGSGLERLPTLAEQAPVVMLTAYASVQDAVQAIQLGAAEYLVKPVNPDELRVVVARALENARLREAYGFCKRLKSRSEKTLVGDSPALNAMKDILSAVAPTDVTVLVQGESGSGKELVARALHDQSGRAKASFVALDCCTLQEKLFESELFGHERGSFTGAERKKKGLIEAAAGGTLFLDEIGEIEPAVQAKLLRVLETGQFRRLGGVKDLNANARIVAATNRDLESMSREGGFRADLFFRLSAFIIEVPPLRERRTDIPDLCRNFLAKLPFPNREKKSFSPAALEQLSAYDWPGNVRELRNVVERAIILSRDAEEILPTHLAFGSPRGEARHDGGVAFDGEPTLEEIERQYLERLLDKYQGHRSKIARVLGVSERNVYRMIKRHGF